MTERDQHTLTLLAGRLRAEFPSARIWAFGSRVRGDADPESDLDVCVVLEQVDPDIRKAVSNLAWEVGFDHDVVISTVVFSGEMFDHGPPSAGPLVAAIHSEGVAA